MAVPLACGVCEGVPLKARTEHSPSNCCVSVWLLGLVNSFELELAMDAPCKSP
jgi:hypothetical protein